MRVVHLIPDFGLGGVQKAGCVLGAHMARLGHAATVVAGAAGPRFLSAPPPNLAHRVMAAAAPRDLARALLDLDPQVIHIHDAAYREPLVSELIALAGDDLRASRRAIVSTPVFGRPPLDRDLL